MRWTQGLCYSFSEGHIIYDCPEGYLKWGEALKRITCACFVKFGAANSWSEPNPQTKKKKLIHGEVRFRLSKPNEECTSLETIGTYTVTQNEFVSFLKTGVLQGRTLNEILSGGKSQ